MLLTDFLRPKKVGGTNIKIDTDVAIVGHCNVTYSLRIDGTDVITSLGTKAPLANPTFTGTVGGVTKAMVGLGSVDNTANAAKPISTFTQTALNLRAPLASEPCIHWDSDRNHEGHGGPLERR